MRGPQSTASEKQEKQKKQASKKSMYLTYQTNGKRRAKGKKAREKGGGVSSCGEDECW